ncbi:MFS transporter [Loigolactobacillus backii]|uniref:MFS transporter n=1 Tax=Loigolactobacillus backii TaxID=375175 RepID=UPI0007F0A1AE|nr:MFS transporter [Loigolactobacillus backii]ANK60796.1 MFS transporter [Loigolactobacillus backii]ANK65750.1 MFS transporter [Loigolactobacillus backii]ANK68226.1 MFS transporter [Loigolactobacillus backii]MDA5388369.1 MFS transporter [Loigolactobacillus backii]MDA5390863.1 MFS transporter [Loigolactobacillus backii]
MAGNTISAGKKGYNRFWFILTLLAGTFTMSISQSALSTAYPTLMRYFNIPASTVQWLTTGFMLVMSVMMPVSPWLLNNVPFKWLYLGVLAIFDLGTLIILLAPNFAVMMTGRVMEAIAVGVLFPSYQTVMLSITPESKRGTTMGLAGLVMGSALAVGPIISGIVLRLTTWQGLFVVFMVIITAVFILGIFQIKSVMPLKPSSIDFLSIICSVGFIGILYVVNQIGKPGVNWGIYTVILLVSLLMVVGFVYRQLHLTEPLLELRVMKSFNYDLSVLLTAISYIALIVVTIIFPLYYQNILHVTPFISGMALVPAAVVLSILNPMTGHLADRFGFRKVMLSGMILICLGWFGLVIFAGHLNIWLMMVFAAIIEGGNAFVMMPAVTLGANSLPDDLIAHGTAVITTVRQILGSTGVAVATLILANVTASHLNQGSTKTTAALAGYHSVFVTFLIIELIGLGLAFLLRGKTKQTA